ncbi:MAG: PEP-CTERM sorting domain-containing protein [Nitrosomonas sp.]|nr:MAG: PEP-CTERM sorting domain-containing protein [Nitrosomonas sp.]
MNKNSILILILLAFLGGSQLAHATILNYSIKGTGSGLLADTAFTNAAFTIKLQGDTSLFRGLDINPLISSQITIAGLGMTTIIDETRLGINGNAIFFSLGAGNGNLDLFDFFLAAPVDLTHSFGPVVGRNVFGLYQFVNVDSSLGPLTFSSSSDVIFQASAVPEPAAVWLLCAGFAGLLGFRRYFHTGA